MSVVLHDDVFRFQQKTLFRPSGHEPPRMVDNSVARIFAIIFCHAKNFSYQPGVFVPSDQPCDLAICGNATFRYFFNNRKYFVYQVFMENMIPRTTLLFPWREQRVFPC